MILLLIILQVMMAISPINIDIVYKERSPKQIAECPWYHYGECCSMQS